MYKVLSFKLRRHLCKLFITDNLWSFAVCTDLVNMVNEHDVRTVRVDSSIYPQNTLLSAASLQFERPALDRVVLNEANRPISMY